MLIVAVDRKNIFKRMTSFLTRGSYGRMKIAKSGGEKLARCLPKSSLQNVQERIYKVTNKVSGYGIRILVVFPLSANHFIIE